MKLPMLTDDDKRAEIRRLYFAATRQTIDQDLTKALDLLKSMTSEEERERVTVFMEGLAQMRADWTPRQELRTKNSELRTKKNKKKF
ncbi:MAG: hypothetical protein AUH43_20080 [Acidobacteria bacterium 13_1_40CM_65_14]|jgi:DNA repair photolyase|nr:MAG: hypothetical protein AUH43_20080 [Acidobacteria bacterium 13_1_40CM_65_14]OLC77451.1 MAG: hypothetical protein AUH72_17520 [Acidobacteria bacterium 13_1_40CM_4_65_8]